jgi:hypothetical protein
MRSLLALAAIGGGFLPVTRAQAAEATPPAPAEAASEAKGSVRSSEPSEQGEQAEKPTRSSTPFYAVASVGVLYSHGFEKGGRDAWGLEGSWTYFPERKGPGYGALVQAQWTSGRFRGALAGQIASPMFGLEGGLSYRQGDDTHQGGPGLHLAPFVSLGFFHVALRVSVPFQAGDGVYPTEVALVIGLKGPIAAPRMPDYFDLNLPHGRALRLGPRDRPCLAPVRARRATSGAAERWARVAQDEQAAVAAFARLALELAQAGAPPQLVVAASTAALEEIAHADDAFAIASAHARSAIGPGPLPASPPRLRTPAELAIESFVDGCLGEGAAAALAARRRTRARGAERAFYARIAREEQEHAALGWAIVRWALDAGGDPVRDALRDLLRARLRRPRDPELRAASEPIARNARRRLRRWLDARAADVAI